MILPRRTPHIVPVKFNPKTHKPIYYAVYLNEFQFKELRIKSFEITKPKIWLIQAKEIDLYKMVIGEKVLRVIEKKFEKTSWKQCEVVKTVYYIISRVFYNKCL